MRSQTTDLVTAARQLRRGAKARLVGCRLHGS